MKTTRNFMIIRNIALIVMLFAAVLIADAAIFTHDIMYPEQPTLYLVNQTIHSFSDLLNVYLHPKGLDDVVPFFRPSGHFLMYQLLVPLAGWHNTRALIAVNLLFLALSGWLMIRIYQLLFPSAKMGGYLAFGIYLMHPALIMPRFLIMHFEFAHVFFLLLGLYFFMIFCQKNLAEKEQPKLFQHFSWLGYALLMFAIAVTFKESALMLGPLMLTYFLLHFYRRFSNRQSWEIAALLLAVTAVLGIYLSLAWPEFAHPGRQSVSWLAKIAVLNQFLKDVSGLQIDLLTQASLPFQTGMAWHLFAFPNFACYTVWACFMIGILNTAKILLTPNHAQLKKSIWFLISAIVIFLIIPCVWAVALPWHWNLSILFLSLLLGFGVDTLLQKLLRTRVAQIRTGFVLFLGLILLSMHVNSVSIADILQRMPMMQLTRAAVFNPPKIQDQLKDDSIILIATRPEQTPYELGNAGFGYMLFKKFNYDKKRKNFGWLYRQYDPHFNGTLFKWAYLKPDLREELFPFAVDQMQTVPNEEIYFWLENINNIFCFTADTQWHDMTAEFRKNLLLEKSRRHLVVNAYDVKYAEHLTGMSLSQVKLPYPDSQLCQYQCDQNILCKGFLFADEESSAHSHIGCVFYNLLSTNSGNDFCASCQGFVKRT